MPVAVVQYWEESERGWGVRPDGLSLHKSMSDRDSYVKEQNDKLPKVPDEHTRVSGDPKPVDVSDEVFAQIDGIGKWFARMPK